LETHIWKVPVILYRKYNETELEDLQIKASADLGGLFLDGYGDGICLSNDSENITFTELKDLSFGILQASRMRMFQKPNLFRAPVADAHFSTCRKQH
jgi:(E)-4-hydroxy-3-methylbut-2-enyl-diphosphate synthase